MDVRASKRLKVSDQVVEDAAFLKSFSQNGTNTEVDLPFDATEISCFVSRARASSMSVKDLVAGLKVRPKLGSAPVRIQLQSPATLHVCNVLVHK